MVNNIRFSLEQVLIPLLHPNQSYPLPDSKLLQAYATLVTVYKQMTHTQTNCLSAYNQILTDYSALAPALLSVSRTCRQRDLIKAARIFSQFDLEDFLRYVTPELVSSKSEIYSISQNDNTELIWVAYQIIQVKYTYYKFAPKKVNAHATPPVSDLYSQYTAIVPKEVQLSKQKFHHFYSAVVLYPLSHNDLFQRKCVGYKKKDLERLAELLLVVLELTRSEAIQFVKKFYVENRQASDEVRHQFLHNFIKKKNIDERTDLLTSALKLAAKMEPIDVLAELEITKCGSAAHNAPIVPNDVPLENGLVFDYFLSTLPPCTELFHEQESKSIAVLFPSVFFVKKCIRDVTLSRALKGRHLTFVFSNEAVCGLINLQYSDAAYGTPPTNISFLTLEQCLTANQAEMPQQILAFFTRVPLSTQGDVYSFLKNCPHRIQIDTLLACHEFESAKSPFSSSLKSQEFQISEIQLIPQGLNNSTEPRRKMLVRITFNPHGSPAHHAAISSFTINTDLGTQALSRTREKPVSVASDLLGSLYRSIRKLYREELLMRKSAGRTRSAPFDYEFTPELHICCSRSYPKSNCGRPRIEAYFVTPASAKKVQRGYMPRGAAINATKKHTTKLADDEIEHWLETVFPFSTITLRQNRAQAEPHLSVPSASISKIRDIVISVMTPLLHGTNITLKTYWYLYPNLMDHFSSPGKLLLEEMATSEIGFVHMRDFTPENCELWLEQYYPSEDQEQLLRRLGILSTVLSCAVVDGYCSENPLQEAIRQDQVTHKLFAQVRRARAKKHFMASEMKLAYQLAEKKYRSGKLEYLGVILRLMTGLSSNIICGLKWKDIEHSKDYGICRLVVTRQVTNDGQTYQGFTSLEDYLSFPCSPLLKEWLDEMFSQFTRASIKVDALKDFPVICTAEKLTCVSQTCTAYPPKNLDRLCREIQDSVGIHDCLVEIPTQNSGTKETNLNQYGGDFYRENFRYWALNSAKLTLDETMYLLGNKPITTAGRYYCDFLSEASQLLMCVKLRRWEKQLLLTSTHKPMCTEEHHTSITRFHEEFQANGGSLHLDLKVCAHAPLQIGISCKCGCTVLVMPIK